MNQIKFRGTWERFLEKFRVTLGVLTDDDLDSIAAGREPSYRKIEDLYEILRGQADNEIAATDNTDAGKELS